MGSTLAHVDALRNIAALLHIGDSKPFALACERAADHIEDLADRLYAAEDDIARLNAQLLVTELGFARARSWFEWACSASAQGHTLRHPRDVSAETALMEGVPYCPTCRTSHPSAPCTPQNREETP